MRISDWSSDVCSSDLLVQPPHHREIGRRHRSRPIVQPAPAQLQQLRLPLHGQLVLPVDHRFALVMPALPSAPDKKSFSSVRCPILACSSFTSTTAGAAPALPPTTPAATSTGRASRRERVRQYGETSGGEGKLKT